MLAEIASGAANTAAPHRPIPQAINDRATAVACWAEKPLSTSTEVGAGPRCDDPFAIKVNDVRDGRHSSRQLSNIDLGCVVTNHMANINLFKHINRSTPLGPTKVEPPRRAMLFVGLAEIPTMCIRLPRRSPEAPYRAEPLYPCGRRFRLAIAIRTMRLNHTPQMPGLTALTGLFPAIYI